MVEYIIYLVLALILDATGNVYITGYFTGNFTGNGAVDFDPNAGIVNLSTALNDHFICKLDTGGNFVWVKEIAGNTASNGTDGIIDITLDTSGNIYTTGYFESVLGLDFNTGIGISVLTTASFSSTFICKLDLNGNFIWAKATEAASVIGVINSGSSSITVDANNSIYITGYFQGNVDFDTGTGVYNLISSGGINDIFVAKYTQCPTITINPTSLPAGAAGTAYNQTITQTGLVGTPTWSVSVGTLPAGLSIAGGSGVISGTPTNAGSSTFTVNVTDGSCSQTKSYTIVISCPTLVFTNTTATNATVGTPYTLNAGVTGNTGTLVYSVLPALPAGLSLNTTNGTISGTPTTATASNTYTVTATQGATCSVTRGYTFLVACTGISINPVSLANGTIGTAYNQTITQTGLVGTPVWSISVGALPAGLSIASGSGVISGTPTTAGSSTFTVNVTDGSCSQTRTYTIVTACPTITFTNTNATIAIINTPYTLNAGATGNTSILTYSVSPALPAGLSINATTGIISGTPTTGVLAAIYTVTATQGVCSATQTYTFAVTNCLPFTLLPDKNFLPSGFVGVPYSAIISVANPLAGVSYRYFKRNAINWQTGLTLNEDTGVISGTPSFSTSINVVIEAVSLPSGCGSTLSTYTLVIYPDPTTSIDNSLDNQVKVYPNPSSDDFNIDFGNINMTKSVVRVYDAQGKNVFSSENNITNNANLMVIPLRNFTKGIYLLEIQTEKGRILKRLAKN